MLLSQEIATCCEETAMWITGTGPARIRHGSGTDEKKSDTDEKKSCVGTDPARIRHSEKVRRCEHNETSRCRFTVEPKSNISEPGADYLECAGNGKHERHKGKRIEALYDPAANVTKKRIQRMQTSQNFIQVRWPLATNLNSPLARPMV